MKAGYGCKIKPCTEKREEDELKMEGIGVKVVLVIWIIVFIGLYKMIPLS